MQGPGGTTHGDSSDLVVDEEGHVAHEPVPTGRVGNAAFMVGSIGLLTATAADSIAVAGRHLGFHLLGSIEIIQAAVVCIASSAMIAATVVGSHASVHILTERLPAERARLWARYASLLSALFFLILVVGSVWVASELWSGFEQTELLGIPLRWLRAIWIAAATLVTILFVRAFARRAA